MSADFQSRRRQRGATLLLMMMMLPIFLIPLVGLAIDGTRLYIIQAKLSSAVDGAVLGAGRLLGTNANTTEIAGEFLNANFPQHFWGTSPMNKSVQFTNALGTYTVKVTATVNAPLLFLRVFGQPNAVVAATATATRKNSRVVLVLDRSGSMDHSDSSGLNAFTAMINASKTFTGMFTPGSDELGLVSLGGSSLVAYPTSRPYSTDPHSSGGPDTGFATSSTAGPMFTQINTMVVGGGTGMAEALSLAYIELQKAHYKDLAANNSDNTMNAIVLFTDGVPSGLAVSPNDPAHNTLKPTGTYANGKSPCTYNPGTNASNTMKGWLAAPGSPPYSTSSLSSQGLYLLSAYDTANTLTWWLGHPTSDQIKSNPAGTGCYAMDVGTGGATTWDMATIPPFDVYGNSTSGTAYTVGKAYNGSTAYNTGHPDQAYHVGIACWNATDNVGKTIRSQNFMQPVAIFTIGYTGSSGGTDAALLKRLANTQDSTSYDSTQQVGMYVQVTTADQLNAAFSAVASELLRLAK